MSNSITLDGLIDIIMKHSVDVKGPNGVTTYVPPTVVNKDGSVAILVGSPPHARSGEGGTSGTPKKDE